MSAFEKTQNKLNKERNEHLEQLVEVSDPSGSAAKEKKAEDEIKDKKSLNYLKVWLVV